MQNTINQQKVNVPPKNDSIIKLVNLLDTEQRKKNRHLVFFGQMAQTSEHGCIYNGDQGDETYLRLK